jgi:ADP-heptose:LPS heptosyltransferase
VSRGSTIACLFNARGDYLLSLPALRALAAAVPGRLVLVVRRGAHETFLRDVDALDVVEADVSYEDGAYHFDATAVAAAALAHTPIDCFVSLNPWSSAVLSELCERLAPRRAAGLGNGPWTHPVALDFGCHSSELALRVVRAVGATADGNTLAYAPAYPPDARRFAQELRDELLGGPLLAVHRDTKPEKQWLDDRWAELLARWSMRHPDGVVIDVGLGPGSKETADRCGERVLNGLALPLSYALAVTSAADAFAGVDSCFLHAADLARVPALGLFFATDAHEFGLRWTQHRHLSAPQRSALDVASVAAALDELESVPSPRLPGRATPAATKRFAGPRNGRAVAAREHRGLALSTIGLGTTNYSYARDRETATVIERLLEVGVNVIDLAANHGGGEACAVVGAGLRPLVARGTVARDDLFLCTKAGFTEHLTNSAAAQSRGWGRHGHCLDVDFLAWEFERQCYWLGVEAIDAFLLQNPEEQLLVHGRDALRPQLEAAFALFERLISEGSLGSYGVSTADALRVPPSDPLHIDLADVEAAARRVGGPSHGFRVIELPVGVAHLEAHDVVAHTLPGDDAPTVSALEWAARMGFLVLASTPLNRAYKLGDLAKPTCELTGIDDDAAALLQVARSVPGVGCALVGITTPAHVSSVAALAGRAPADLTAPVAC